jgi:hypothetical protein
MTYTIQQRIHTLSHNAVIEDGRLASFSVSDIRFSHWDEQLTGGWKEAYWIATFSTDAANFQEAYITFRKKMGRIVPRIAFVSQCYVESALQPLMILKDGSDIAFFKYAKEIKGVGLMFREPEVKALKNLLENNQIPEAFFLYWNDAVNTLGYSSKLLVMFSAIEALFKGTDKKQFYKLVGKILGPELLKQLYGTKERPDIGLRQRLVHGEYLQPDDTNTNYVDSIHKAMIRHFNDEIFSATLLHVDVKNPQRHIFGNTEHANVFVRAKKGTQLTLKEICSDSSENDLYELQSFELVSMPNPLTY